MLIARYTYRLQISLKDRSNLYCGVLLIDIKNNLRKMQAEKTPTIYKTDEVEKLIIK